MVGGELVMFVFGRWRRTVRNNDVVSIFIDPNYNSKSASQNLLDFRSNEMHFHYYYYFVLTICEMQSPAVLRLPQPSNHVLAELRLSQSQSGSPARSGGRTGPEQNDLQRQSGHK